MTRDQYELGRDQGLEEAAELLHARAQNLICGKKRTNQIDRHTSAVLARARDDIRAKRTVKTADYGEKS